MQTFQIGIGRLQASADILSFQYPYQWQSLRNISRDMLHLEVLICCTVNYLSESTFPLFSCRTRLVHFSDAQALLAKPNTQTNGIYVGVDNAHVHKPLASSLMTNSLIRYYGNIRQRKRILLTYTASSCRWILYHVRLQLAH